MTVRRGRSIEKLALALACSGCPAQDDPAVGDGDGSSAAEQGEGDGSSGGGDGTQGEEGEPSETGEASSSTPGDDDGESGATTDEPACSEVETFLAPSLLRRLTRVEYMLSLQELFELDAPPDVSSIPDDPNEEGFRTLTALNSISPQHIRGYLGVAEQLAADLMDDPQRRDNVLGCTPSEPACLEQFVAKFGRLAFRRPLQSDEVDAIVATATSAALDEDDGFRVAMEAILVSPNFVFRIEGSGTPGELTELSGLELASRLSFAVWGRGPNDALLTAAEQGELDTKDGLLQHARTALADPRSQAFYDSFFEQWIGFESLREPTEAPQGWYPGILDDLKQETHALLRGVVWSPEHAFVDVFTASESTVTRELAEFYGMTTPPAGGEITFPATSPRNGSGILTHPSVLSAKTDGDLVAKRGAWFRKTFMCQTFEVPEGLFEMLGDRLVGLTYLEILAERNTDVACAGCHSMIDPIGVGLANWDANGLLDPEIDTSEYGIAASIPGVDDSAFETPAELATLLARLPEVEACLAERVFLFTHGREADGSGEDACSVEAALSDFEASGQFPDLVLGLIANDAFRYRRNPTEE